jgi:hypothetical protein
MYLVRDTNTHPLLSLAWYRLFTVCHFSHPKTSTAVVQIFKPDQIYRFTDKTLKQKTPKVRNFEGKKSQRTNVDGQNVKRKNAEWDQISNGKNADWDKRYKIINIDWGKTSKSNNWCLEIISNVKNADLDKTSNDKKY